MGLQIGENMVSDIYEAVSHFYPGIIRGAVILLIITVKLIGKFNARLVSHFCIWSHTLNHSREKKLGMGEVGAAEKRETQGREEDKCS